MGSKSHQSQWRSIVRTNLFGFCGQSFISLVVETKSSMTSLDTCGSTGLNTRKKYSCRLASAALTIPMYSVGFILGHCFLIVSMMARGRVIIFFLLSVPSWFIVGRPGSLDQT